MKLTRRTLLAGAASALPTLWLPRVARAARTPAFGAVKHLLVLFAKGGLRSHCLFNAVGTAQHNPFGVQPAAPGTEWSLGAACGADDIPITGGVIPAFPRITADVAVVPCVDHTPGSPAPEVDHRTAVNRIASGFEEAQSGFLAYAGREMERYAQGFSPSAVPPVEIRPTEFGLGAGDYAETRPLSVIGAASAFSAQLPVGKGWKIAARNRLDARFLERRSKAFDARISTFLLSKRYAAVFADMLADPLLNVVTSPAAQAGGFTNAQLIEAFGDQMYTDLGDTLAQSTWGADVALALRFFGFGAPIAVVTRDIHDMHDDERTAFAPRTKDLVRQLAALHHVLRTMPHASGGRMWDHTLVVVLSEFSRNNTGANGFNSGNGSDHVGEGAGPMRNQAVAFMGGAVRKPGKLIGATDAEMNAIGPVFSSRSLLSTLMDVVGMDHTRHWADPPIAELFT